MEAIATAIPRHPGLTRERAAAVLIGGLTVVAGAALWMADDAVFQRLAADAVALVLLALAAIAISAAPRSPVGALLAVQAMTVVLTNSTSSLPPVFAGAWMLLYLPSALLLLTAPSGRAASRRWAWAGWALAVSCVLFIALCAMQALLPLFAAAGALVAVPLLLAFFALLVICAIAPIARYRRADEDERLRLRWVLVAGLSLPLTLLLCWTSYLVLGGPDLVVFGLITMMLSIAAGVVTALVRPRLFDVDRAAVATVAGAVLAAAMLLVLTIATVTTGILIVDWSPTFGIVMTAAIALGAALSFPVLLRGLDRVLYPERAKAVAALRALSVEVDRDGTAPESVESTLRAALRDPGLRIGYRIPGRPGLRTANSTILDVPANATPVHVRGEDIGAILPARARPVGVDIARAAAPLIDAARSRAQLSHLNAQIEASRSRLLRAGYEARRQLERDLHDGTQQRLVAVGMRLRILQRTAHDADLASALDGAVADLSTAIAELRQIAHGVRPSALDDGLAAALGHLGRSVDPVIELEIHADDVPDAVATTAYYVVSEAVANALRHADAVRVNVSVRLEADLLRIRVLDDGRGGAVARPTGGITGLADRVAAHGGTLEIVSPVGGGTSIEAVLPCAS